MAELGFVGLGVMGSRMVERLLGAGHRVTGWNRTATKAEWLIEKGMCWAESPRAAAEAADVVFSMVSDTSALQRVTEGEEGILAGLGPGKIADANDEVIDTTGHGISGWYEPDPSPWPNRRAKHCY